MEATLDILLKVLWPLALAYTGYIHRQYLVLHEKFDNLFRVHHEHVATVNKDFASRATVTELENRLTAVLNRIDDKVTRILERDNH